MKNSKRIPTHNTRVVCTDGSTINIDFPFSKNDIFLMNDLKNNPHYFAPSQLINVRDLSKTKQKSLQFDFFTLLQNNK